MSEICIVIVNYNGQELLESCVRSLFRQSNINYEIVVVDNASTDDSVEHLKELVNASENACSVRFYSMPYNSGFSSGSNVGIRCTDAEYVALLNADTEVDPNWLRQLAAAMNTHKEAGICASRLIVHGSKTIDSAGDGFSTNLKGFKRGEGLLASQYAAEEYIFGACAGAALYRREMLDEIGFFDEEFFLIYEDADLNFRAQLAGWKVLYVPTALVQHKVRSSIGELSDMAIYYSVRNCELVRMKNVPLLVFLRCLPWFLLGEIMDFAYFSLKLKKFDLYCRAKFDAIRLFPSMLKKRRNIMKKRKVPNKYLMSMLTPVWRKEFVNSKIKKLLCN